MSQYGIGRYRIPLRHGSRKSRQRFDRHWSLAEEVTLDPGDWAEDWTPRRDPRVVDDQSIDGFFGPERIPSCWWLLIAPGAGRLVFREAHPNQNGPSEAVIPFPGADPFRQFEDVYCFVRERFRGDPTPFINDQEQAIVQLGAHPYFHQTDAVGFDTATAEILGLIIDSHAFWIRSPRDWQPPRGTPEQALADLFAHLIYRYPVPPWLDDRRHQRRVFEQDLKWLALAIFVGRGGSFYDAAEYLFLDFRGRPIFTRRGVFHLGNAPDYDTMNEAVYHALILQSGGDETALCDFRSQLELPSPMFGAAVVREVSPWLAKNRPNLAPGLGTLVIAWFCFRMEGPPDAHRRLTLRRRSVRSVLAEIRADLSGSIRGGWNWRLPLSWQDTFRGWDRAVTWADLTWRFTQICTLVRLAQESEEMNHCVVLYFQACASGETFIFSLASNRGDRLTLQICPLTHFVLQIRGYANRAPTPTELAVVDEWMRSIHLRSAPSNQRSGLLNLI